MIPQLRPLIEVFSDIPDVRQSRGKRHPLSAILALSCCAMLCGVRSYSAIAEWGRNYGSEIAHALGFTHNTPCASTLHTIFRRLDCEVFEAKLGVWAERGVTQTPATPEAPEAAMAVDGKTLRGSKKQGAPGTHLLSVLAHRLGLTLTQQAVAAKTNEIKEVETVLSQIVLTDRVVTMDALLTQRQVAQTIVDAGGDYVMIVKENQPQLKADIELVFTLPPAGDRQESMRTVDVGHGRIETRNLTTSEALVGYSDWPGLAQVFEVGRHVITKKTETERIEMVYGVTSLSPERATPGRVLELVRGHWAIENKSHWVRDVTFDEDRSQVRCGNIPQVMAALRNTAIGLLRWAGHTNIAAACRRLAAQPAQALALIGIGRCFKPVDLLPSRSEGELPTRVREAMIIQMLHCPYCQGIDIVKHGMSPEGKQRYRCRTCLEGRGRTFLLEYTYAGQSPAVKQQIVDMAMNASGIRDTARVLHVSPTTVIKELKKKNLSSIR